MNDALRIISQSGKHFAHSLKCERRKFRTAGIRLEKPKLLRGAVRIVLIQLAGGEDGGNFHSADGVGIETPDDEFRHIVFGAGEEIAVVGLCRASAFTLPEFFEAGSGTVCEKRFQFSGPLETLVFRSDAVVVVGQNVDVVVQMFFRKGSWIDVVCS